MAWSTKTSPTPDHLPPWARGRISLYAFKELKRCLGPYGYAGRRDTMRRLADKGLVRQIESGAYVVTENGIDLIEGRYRHPVDAPDVAMPPTKQYPAAPRRPSQEAASIAKASRSAVASYTVEPTRDGCDVIRPWFGPATREGKA